MSGEFIGKIFFVNKRLNSEIELRGSVAAPQRAH
jgi:hypothetical protein